MAKDGGLIGLKGCRHSECQYTWVLQSFALSYICIIFCFVLITITICNSIYFKKIVWSKDPVQVILPVCRQISFYFLNILYQIPVFLFLSLFLVLLFFLPFLFSLYFYLSIPPITHLSLTSFFIDIFFFFSFSLSLSIFLTLSFYLPIQCLAFQFQQIHYS